MALAIATNNAALQAAASASSVNRDMETSMARLSTGKRINSARDDAAGVAIASRLSSEIRGTDQAIRNAMDGQALIDTAEGGHSEIENVLQRMREVAVQSANDTNDLSDRANLQAEIKALVTEIDRIASVTTWAGQTMMSDIGSKFTFQVGTATGDKNQIGIDIKAMSKTALGISGGATAGSINPVSSGIGMVGDSATGMITFNAQHATDFSSMIENTPLSLTSTLMASPKSMSDVSYPASAAVGTNTTNAFTASANNTDTTVVIDGNTFTSTAAVAKSISDVSYPTSGNSAVGTDTTNAFKASALDLSTSIEIGGTTFTTHVVNSDTFKGATGGTNITDVATGSSKETQSFTAALPNVAAKIEIDGIPITTTGNASAMSVIDLNKNLALLINEDPRMIERGVTATVNSAGDEVTIAYAKEAMSVAAINTHLASQINASSAMAAIGVKANAATVAGEVTLTFNVPDTSVSALNADLAAKINASAEMQTLGIKADTTTASGEVTLAFGVNGKPHRDATAAGFAARINNDPSFLAKGILAVAQTDAAVLGSTANGGGTAQSLVFTGTSSMAGARFEIKGTDANGIPMTEMVIGTGTSNKTVQDFLTVETITQIGDTDVASNISIGTASDADGILDATDTAAGLINFGTNATNVMVNARVELLHGADDMSTAAKARHAVTVLDGAIKSVNTQRSNLGAVSNRLSHTVSNLTNISSNLSAAKGGIEDADFALETTALAKNQILQQASTAMLAQANAAKQNVLSLLQG